VCGFVLGFFFFFSFCGDGGGEKRGAAQEGIYARPKTPPDFPSHKTYGRGKGKKKQSGKKFQGVKNFRCISPILSTKKREEKKGKEGGER